MAGAQVQSMVGGYRSKASGKEYLNAQQQTDECWDEPLGCKASPAHSLASNCPERNTKEKADGSYEAEQSSELHRTLNRLTPPTDFVQLRKDIESWRSREIEAVKSGGFEHTVTRAAILSILEKETRMFAALDRLKARAHGQSLEAAAGKCIEKQAKPLQVLKEAGGTISIYRPEAILAAKAMKAFEALRSPSPDASARLALLQQVKELSFAQNRKELLSLIDREMDLLKRGVQDEHIQGLRKRIILAFAKEANLAP